MTYDQGAWYARMREVLAAGERVTLATICPTHLRPLPILRPDGRVGGLKGRCSCAPILLECLRREHDFSAAPWRASGMASHRAMLTSVTEGGGA